MHDIFLSYSQSNKIIAQKIKQNLRDSSYNILTAEDTGQDTIENLILRSEAFLSILSPQAMTSGESVRELMVARQFHKQTALLLVDGTPEQSIPHDYESLRFFDFRKPTEFEVQMKHLVTVLFDAVPFEGIIMATFPPEIIPLPSYLPGSQSLRLYDFSKLPEQFKKTYRDVQSLRKQYFEKSIDARELLTKLEQCKVFWDDTWWMMGTETDKWYMYSNQRQSWEVATPPSISDIDT